MNVLFYSKSSSFVVLMLQEAKTKRKSMNSVLDRRGGDNVVGGGDIPLAQKPIAES